MYLLFSIPWYREQQFGNAKRIAKTIVDNARMIVRTTRAANDDDLVRIELVFTCSASNLSEKYTNKNLQLNDVRVETKYCS